MSFEVQIIKITFCTPLRLGAESRARTLFFMVWTGKAESQSLLFKMKIKISIRCKIKRRGFGAKNGDIYKLLDDVIYCIMTVSDCSNKYDAFEKRGVVTCRY